MYNRHQSQRQNPQDFPIFMDNTSTPAGVVYPASSEMVQIRRSSRDPQGLGDARPTALQIVKDENLSGKLAGKSVFITGANQDLGLETARALHSTGATVYLGARDRAKGQKAIDDIRESDPATVIPAELIAGTLRKFNITAQNLGYYIGDNATSNDTCLEELSKVLEAELGYRLSTLTNAAESAASAILSISPYKHSFSLAQKEALRAALEATADEPGSAMLEEFSQQLHELDPEEIAAHSDTTTQQQGQQEERQEQPTRKPIKARGKRSATTHQQASNNDERFAGWQGIPALAKLHGIAVYVRSSALHNDQWYDAVEFLQPFYEATLEAEGAMASISQSLELLDLLLGHCEKWKAHYSQPSNRDDRIIHSIDMCWFILDNYYTMTEDVPVYAAALLLDPFKRKSYIEECWPEEWHEGAFAAARNLWKEEYNHDVEIHLSEQSLAVPALLKRKKDTMLSKMRLEVRNKTMARARGKDDFDNFISEAPIALPEDTTPLQ
ncbi:hypothetical protein ACJZ2D_016318 [Fusarium nematophilum]